MKRLIQLTVIAFWGVITVVSVQNLPSKLTIKMIKAQPKLEKIPEYEPVEPEETAVVNSESEKMKSHPVKEEVYTETVEVKKEKPKPEPKRHEWRRQHRMKGSEKANLRRLEEQEQTYKPARWTEDGTIAPPEGEREGINAELHMGETGVEIQIEK